jgi:Icc protein
MTNAEAKVPETRWDDWLTPDGTPVDRPTHVIAHLSDTHLTSAGVLYNKVLDSAAALDRAIAVLNESTAGGRHLDAVIASGDLTDSGDPAAYQRLAAAVGSIQTGSNRPQPIFVTGNHDIRTEFHRQLLHRTETDGPILQVHDVQGLRVVVLDSTIPGAGHGRLSDDHLAELRAELERPAPAGTIVTLHHAPVRPPSPLLSYFALENASRLALAAAIRGTDVRLILAGHHHIAQSGMLGGVQVAVAGSTTIRTDPLAPAGHDRTWASGSFNLVEVYPDTVTVSVIPVDGAAVVFDLDEAGCRSVIDQHPIDRPAAVPPR